MAGTPPVKAAHDGDGLTRFPIVADASTPDTGFDGFIVQDCVAGQAAMNRAARDVRIMPRHCRMRQPVGPGRLALGAAMADGSRRDCRKRRQCGQALHY
jgi:hypothetical protein